MDTRPISADLAVGPQIAIDDLAELKRHGYRAVICNRPDGEGADQPGHEEMDAAARAEGLEFCYLPVSPGPARDEDADAFGAALRALPGPVMAYCRSGMRSATLWSLSEAGSRPMPEILAATKAAGYDMTGVARRIANGGARPPIPRTPPSTW